MYQPEVKYEFVRRYCPPTAGWHVFVDIDPSEEGRTGGERLTDAAKLQRDRMQVSAQQVRLDSKALGIQIGGCRRDWFNERGLPRVPGDRDVVAFHRERRACVIAEVEGASSGQPETKLYKAIGQLVMAVSEVRLPGWETAFVLVVHGKEFSRHLARATALSRMGVSALTISANAAEDEWHYHAHAPQMLPGYGIGDNTGQED